jgi:hypothetical protein
MKPLLPGREHPTVTIVGALLLKNFLPKRVLKADS